MTRPYSPSGDFPEFYPEEATPFLSETFSQSSLTPRQFRVFGTRYESPTRSRRGSLSRINEANDADARGTHSWVFRTHRGANRSRSGDASNSTRTFQTRSGDASNSTRAYQTERINAPYVPIQSQHLERNREQNVGRNIGRTFERIRERKLERNRQQHSERNRERNSERNREQNLERIREQNLERNREQNLERIREQNLERNREQNLERNREQNLEFNGEQSEEENSDQNLEKNREQILEQNEEQNGEQHVDRTREQHLQQSRDQRLERMEKFDYHNRHQTHTVSDEDRANVCVQKFKQHRRKLRFLLDEPATSELPLPCDIPSEYEMPATSEDEDGVAECADQLFEEEYARRIDIGRNLSDNPQDLPEVPMDCRPSSSTYGQRNSDELPTLNTRPSTAPLAGSHYCQSYNWTGAGKESNPLESTSQITYYFPNLDDISDNEDVAEIQRVVEIDDVAQIENRPDIDYLPDLEEDSTDPYYLRLQHLCDSETIDRPSTACCAHRPFVDLPVQNPRPATVPQAHASNCSLLRMSKELESLDSTTAITYFFPDIQDLPDPGKDNTDGYMLAVRDSAPRTRHPRQDQQSRYWGDNHYKNFRNILAQSCIRQHALQHRSRKLYRDNSQEDFSSKKCPVHHRPETFPSNSPWVPYKKERDKSKGESKDKKGQLSMSLQSGKFVSALRNDRWAPSFLVQEYYLERVPDHSEL